MKKALFKAISVLLLLMLLVFSFLGCDYGSKRITDPEQYGKFASYIELPSFFPNSIESFTVNSYAYNLESWLDTCYEIFLDITVTKEQFDELAKNITVRIDECYYAEGFYEAVFMDSYDVFTDEGDGEMQVVGYADIEKIVYNPETYQIIFVAFHANDTGVYPLSDFQYFNRFKIDENEYAEHIRLKNKQKLSF